MQNFDSAKGTYRSFNPHNCFDFQVIQIINDTLLYRLHYHCKAIMDVMYMFCCKLLFFQLKITKYLRKMLRHAVVNIQFIAKPKKNLKNATKHLFSFF